MTREFDLNIERVLENWTVAHALREVIANALDEQALTGTAEPQIFRDAEDRWHLAHRGPGDAPAGVPVHPCRSSALSSVFVVQNSSRLHRSPVSPG